MYWDTEGISGQNEMMACPKSAIQSPFNSTLQHHSLDLYGGNEMVQQCHAWCAGCKQSYGFFESFSVGIERGKDQLVGYWKQLQMIFTPSTGAYKGVGGFKAIFDIFPAYWSWEAFWSITALLSIMLGVMNLLPIPALDGGHVMFLLYEIISRRKPSDKFMENAQMVGFVLLISLLLFANGNDIYKAIVGK